MFTIIAAYTNKWGLTMKSIVPISAYAIKVTEYKFIIPVAHLGEIQQITLLYCDGRIANWNLK